MTSDDNAQEARQQNGTSGGSDGPVPSQVAPNGVGGGHGGGGGGGGQHKKGRTRRSTYRGYMQTTQSRSARHQGGRGVSSSPASSSGGRGGRSGGGGRGPPKNKRSRQPISYSKATQLNSGAGGASANADERTRELSKELGDYDTGPSVK